MFSMLKDKIKKGLRTPLVPKDEDYKSAVGLPDDDLHHKTMPFMADKFKIGKDAIYPDALNDPKSEIEIVNFYRK